MRLHVLLPASFAALITTLAAASPAAVRAANVAEIRVTAVAPGAVRVAGTIAGTNQLQVVLSAQFAAELAAGNFDTIVTIAPAYFTGAVVTASAQTSHAVIVGRGTMTIVDPSRPH